MRGLDIEPGTDTHARDTNRGGGETRFAAGEGLSATDALPLGELCCETVAVFGRLSTGVLGPERSSTGIARRISTPRYSRRSRGHVARAEGTVPDERDRVRERIVEVAEHHDVVLTTGGTRVGTTDHVITGLTDPGDVPVHRAAVGPGKPIDVARLPVHDAVAIVRPGHPIGAHTIATLVVRPFSVGEEPPATVTASLPRDVDVGPLWFEDVVPVTGYRWHCDVTGSR